VKAEAHLILLALSEGPNIDLEKPIILIGRHQECDIQIPSRKISRRHCCIALVNDHLVIRDLGSTNGVRINGIKVVEGNLQANDEVMIGNMRYQLKWQSESEHTQRSPNENGVKAGPPPVGRPANQEESRDEPIPIADVEPQPRPLSLEFPDSGNIPLVPLDPPSK